MIIADRVKQLEEEIQSAEERLSDIRQTASGEANTASNIGIGGIGVYDQKVGVDLQFRNIIAASALITIALNAGNNEIEIDAVPGQIDHDSLLNFVANKHIDHTAVSVSAGTGLSGGGTIAANRTINLSHLGIQILADPGADRIMFWDETAGAMKWLSLGNSLNIVLTVMDTIQDIRTSASPQFAGLTLTGNLIIPDGGTIGSASANSAITIAADGDVKFWENIGSGNPKLTISGWDSNAAALDTYSINAEMDAGGGTRLTIGLDETMRAMVICDYGDIAVDFGLGPSAYPILFIFDPDGNFYGSLKATTLTLRDTNAQLLAGTTYFQFLTKNRFWFSARGDLAAGHMVTFDSLANAELTDTNAEQAWMALYPKIKQTNTAGYIGFLMDVTEISVGSGLNALMDLRVATVSKFMIDNSGGIFPGGMKSGANQGASGAAVDELWHDTNDNTIKMGV